MTRTYDKGDQPSCGETSRTNTGATRSGRGQHKTWRRHAEVFAQLRTLRLPNDDDKKSARNRNKLNYFK